MIIAVITSSSQAIFRIELILMNLNQLSYNRWNAGRVSEGNPKELSFVVLSSCVQVLRYLID